MLETVVGAIASPIFEQLLNVGGSVAKEIKAAKDDVSAINKRLEACRRYEQRYGDRHGRIKIMPGLMKEDVPLESVYTAVKLLDDRSLRYFRTEQDLEEAYRQSARRSFQVGTDERLDGMEVANQKQFLMVLGGPGIGKSTFLKKLGMEALKSESQLKWGRIPVFIELKELRDSDIDLVKIIAKEFEVCGFPAAEAFAAQALSQGKLLVLFDGLDEVPKVNLNVVTKRIEDFVDLYDGNCFVASCRIAAYSSSFRRFTDVTIAEFDDEQIEQFIRRWFTSELDRNNQTADKYWELLSQPDHRATKELAQTPLLLTFLCLVYDREQTLPPNRSTLYGDALNILMKEWAAQKRLERDPIYEGFHPALQKELLAQIAYDSFKEDRLFFSQAEITAQIAEFLSDTLDAPKYLDGEAVLKAIEVQQGLLVERATDTYSFSHLTIQEYLTAHYIVANDLIEETVEQHVLEDRWREVFLLIAGLVSQKQLQKFLAALEQATHIHIAKSQKLETLLRWVENVIDTNSRREVTIKATAIYIAVHAAHFEKKNMTVERASVIARILTSPLSFTRTNKLLIESAIDSVRNFTQLATGARSASVTKINRVNNSPYLEIFVAQGGFNIKKLSQLPDKVSQLRHSHPGENALYQEWQQWANELERVWLNGFALTKEMVTLTQQDAEALADYLYITELLIRCKESAVRVSKREWEEMEARLLTLRGCSGG